MEKINLKIRLILAGLIAFIGLFFTFQEFVFSESVANTGKSEEQIMEDSPFGFHPAVPYSEANNIGIRWTRGGGGPYIFWSLVDPNMTGDPVQFQWTTAQGRGNTLINYDGLFSAQKAGLNMLHNIDVQPARGSYRRTGSWLPVNKQAYKNFVMGAVNRYYSIRYWQVGNEPMAGLPDYGQFLSLTYEAIKEARPQAKVLIGGISGMKMPQTIAEYKTNFNQFYLPLLQDVAKQGKRCFDIFDFHWYGDATGDYRLSRDIYNYIRQTIKELGIPEPEEYWITEMGTYSGDPKPVIRGGNVAKDWPYQSERQQAIDLVKRYVYPLSFGVKKVFMAYGLKEGFKYNEGYFDFTGLIYDGNYAYDQGSGVKKLGYYTYKKMTEILEGSNWGDIKEVQGSGGIYIYKFTKNGRPVWVAWNDNSDERQVVISDIPLSRVEITEAVPKYELGKDVKDYTNAFRSKTELVSGRKVRIILGGVPVYIR